VQISLDLVREIRILTSLSGMKHVVELIETFFASSGDIVMVFEYMEADLYGLLLSPAVVFSEAHVKCIVQQVMVRDAR